MKNPSLRLVFDRRRSASKTRKGLVQVEITYERRRRFFSTNVKVFSDQWDDRKMVIGCRDASALNEKITSSVGNIRSFLRIIEDNRTEFSFDALDTYLGNKSDKKDYNFIEFMRERIEKRSICSKSKERAMCVWRALRDFGEIVEFSDLTPKNIKLWDDYARSKCTKQSAVYNYHKHLKTYVREAVALEFISNNPYNGIRLEKGITSDRRFLTIDELKAIEECEINSPQIDSVRDVFIFECYTGIAPVDLRLFDFTQINEVSGKYRIRDFRAKTGTQYNITLLSKAVEILKKYNFKLPLMPEHKNRIFLKAVAAIAKVKKPFTPYAARHTFATTITLANGVPIEIVSKMLGHTNIQTTQIYAKVLATSVDRAFDELEDKLNS